MLEQLPYCGLPPSPAELLARFNLDPVLLLALAGFAAVHCSRPISRSARWYAGAGWLVASIAFVSPLCALSVSLFSARVAQHMILVLIAAPLIAEALPLRQRTHCSRWLWIGAALFMGALWFWHMPRPYDATFRSTSLYWAMHFSLFGSAILLWRELLHHARDCTVDALLLGALTSIQMGLLGAVLTFAGHPLFLWHLTTTAPWGFTPLRDQQLGGVFMWVPGIALFLYAILRSLRKLCATLEEPARPV